MSGPVLTPEEISQMQKEKAKAISAAATFQDQVSAQTARAAELAKVDSGFKKFFDYYNDDIIGKYDSERRSLNGQYVDTPIVESDITSAANLEGGRLQPSLPDTDLIRISQFDGTPLLQDSSHESSNIADQATLEDQLVNGFSGLEPSSSVLTNSTLSSGSTTLQLKDLTTTFSISPNSTFIIADGSSLAVVKILTFTMQSSPVPPPYIADCTIQIIVPPSSPISSGEQLQEFNGFTNPERTSKTSSDPDLQPLMDYFVSAIQSKINTRISKLNDQLTAISSNLDPDGAFEFAQATTDVNTSKTFLTSYLVSTDISDTGLSSLSTERSTRSGQITTRLAQILSAYTGRSKNYYNERYSSANNRGNTSRGSLRLQKAAEQSSSASQSFATSLQAQADAIGGILP